jgi:hypothetical protein
MEVTDLREGSDVRAPPLIVIMVLTMVEEITYHAETSKQDHDMPFSGGSYQSQDVPWSSVVSMPRTLKASCISQILCGTYL